MSVLPKSRIKRLTAGLFPLFWFASSQAGKKEPRIKLESSFGADRTGWTEKKEDRIIGDDELFLDAFFALVAGNF